jgi:hypothetical protein
MYAPYTYLSSAPRTSGITACRSWLDSWAIPFGQRLKVNVERSVLLLCQTVSFSYFHLSTSCPPPHHGTLAKVTSVTPLNLASRVNTYNWMLMAVRSAEPAFVGWSMCVGRRARKLACETSKGERAHIRMPC